MRAPLFDAMSYPGSKPPSGMVPGTLTGLRASSLPGFAAALICHFLPCLFLAALPLSAQAPAAAARDTNPANFVGSEACVRCHQETVHAFSANPHSKSGREHSMHDATCESCHGAGKAHIDAAGDRTKIFNPSTATAAEIDQTCLRCHQQKHADFERSAHGKGNVSCLGCHSIHKSQAKSLLAAGQPGLCYQCHAEAKAQFSLPFHHKVDEGQVACSECHDVHNSPDRANLHANPAQNTACLKCHKDQAGPFTYEHAAVKTEGCPACHVAHGGSNPHLLTRASVDAICTQCHFSAAAPPPASLAANHNPQPPHQECTACHPGIHGSNTSPKFMGGPK